MMLLLYKCSLLRRGPLNYFKQFTIFTFQIDKYSKLTKNDSAEKRSTNAYFSPNKNYYLLLLLLLFLDWFPAVQSDGCSKR